jgi:hypothetical protein
MLVGLAVKSTFVENQDRDPGIRFTCSTTSCVKVEMVYFDSFTCFRDLLEV